MLFKYEILTIRHNFDFLFTYLFLLHLIYLNRGSGKVASLPGFHTFSGTDINELFLSNGKKKC